MTDTTLSQPPVPISSNSGHISKEPTTLTFRCRDRHFRDAVACDENGDPLFTLGASSLWTSWSYRRTLRSAADDNKHVLDVRLHNSKLKEWVVEDRWWTGRPLRRRYFELVLTDGRNVVVFRDLVGGGWFLQRS